VTSVTRTGTTQPGGVRAAISLLVLIPVLVPLFAALLIWFSEGEAARAAEDKVVAAARIASANVRLLVESTRERLIRMDQQLGPDPAEFVPRAGNVEGMVFSGLYDGAGFTLGREGVRGVNVSDNADFKVLAAGKPWQVTPLLGTSETLRFFGIARRLERDGKFAGVYTAFLPADALSEVWATVALGADSTVGLIRDDGMMVTRFPVPEKALDLKDYELFTEHLKKSPSGIYHADASPVDGHPRTVAYEKLADLGLVIVASMSRTSGGDAFWSRVASTALVAGPIFLIMVILCGWAILLLLRHERSRGELQAALAQNRVLFQEIHHRVKNNLQAVAAMVKLQQAPAAMKEDLTRRIAAMSAVHQHIYESDQFGALDAQLAPLQLHADQALPLGLIVNEVISNAFKHAFPDGRPGKVMVDLARPLEGDEAILTITDNGVGMSDTPSGGRGLGARLIVALASQLGGKSETIRDNGVRFELRFPVTQSATR
jgi:two-component system, sensor histidine kinase PdtaS